MEFESVWIGLSLTGAHCCNTLEQVWQTVAMPARVVQVKILKLKSLLFVKWRFRDGVFCDTQPLPFRIDCGSKLTLEPYCCFIVYVALHTINSVYVSCLGIFGFDLVN